MATGAGFSISTNGGTAWVNKTTANGLGSNNVYAIKVVGSNLYAATNGGLSISTDSGVTWINKTVANSGLLYDAVEQVEVVGSTIYVSYSAMFSGTLNYGLSISTDNGTSWNNNYTQLGLPANTNYYSLFATGSTIYASGYGIYATGL